MQFIPIKTRVMQPPQDDLLSVLDGSLGDFTEGDVLMVSSKVVAIHEGTCIPTAEGLKEKLVQEEADVIIPRDYYNTPLTLAHNTFIGAAGIDESNGDGHLILLPKDLFLSAKNLYEYIKAKKQLKYFGIVIIDSQSTVLRYGATGVALSWWGIRPLQDHCGRSDLFGRAIKHERSNIVDGLAAAATVVSGEVDECMPLVIARAVPNLVFTEENTKDELFATFEDDGFRVLYQNYLNN